VEASLRELNSNSSALARRAQAGETVIITDHGVPIADLVPHRASPGVRHRDATRVFATLQAISSDADSWQEVREQMDAAVDPYIDLEGGGG